ncbi:MAG: hypothetical protein ACT4OJ_16215 [Bacteroidota bacterium]
MRINIALGAIAALSLTCSSCSKSASPPEEPAGPYVLSYGDSILYMKAAAGDYIVNPVSTRPGTYSGFPEGIEIDGATGAINISKSETGLRYRITHTATDGTKTETKLVLSGITFTDKFYHLSAGDSVAIPVYNSSASRVLPLAGSSFDEGNICNNAGCAVKTTDGTINLAATVRNGVFGVTPRNDERRTFEIKYRINDASGKTENKLKVLLYWYNTMSDVPADVWEILNGRQSEGVFLRGQTAETVAQAAKPRPPCVIIIAN